MNHPLAGLPLRTARHLLCLLVAPAIVSACNDAATRPAEPRLEGSYTATTFTVTSTEDTFDLLAEGVALTITLRGDGTMTGTQFVPNVTRELTGTWDTAAAILHLQQPQPHLLNQIPFAIGPDALRGEFVAPQGTIRLILARQTASQ